MLPNIQFYGGIQGIGGNQILVVASNGKAVLLDFGFDFGISGQYFDGFMKIRDKQALVDALKIGMMPWPTGDLKGIYRNDLSALNQDWIQACYDGEISGIKNNTSNIINDLKESSIVTDLLLSHAHLDHVGSIKYLHPSINIVCSETTKIILERLDVVSGSGSTFNDIISYKPLVIDQESDDDIDSNGVEDGQESLELEGKSKKTQYISRNIIPCKEKEDFIVADGGLRIQFWPVDHSIPGAGAFLIEDTQTKQRLIYTGDFRLHGPSGYLTKDFIESAMNFHADSLIIEGTRITPDPSLEPHLINIDDRKNQFKDENDVKMHIIDFLQTIHMNDPHKLVCFNCSNRDLWRLGSLYQAAVSNGRTLVVDSKIYDLIHYLDPNSTKFGIDKTRIKVYLPRKDLGIYCGSDYKGAPAIREVFHLPMEQHGPLLKQYDEECRIKHESKYISDMAEYNKEMVNWVANGSILPKPRKPADRKYKTKTELPKPLQFWVDAPFRISAKEIHDNQGQYLLYLSPFVLNELFDIQPDPGSYYISSTSSPFDEEGVLDERRRNNWFKLFKIPVDNGHIGNFHCSGHIAEEQIFQTIDKIKPKVAYLVHSEGKSVFQSKLNGSIKGIVPQLGTKYSFN